MIKIIGNFYILCMLFCAHISADISMQFRTTDGKILEQAFVGQPFTIEIEISDMPRDAGEPKIFSLHEISLQRTGLYMSSINGHATKKYSYLARIDAPGTYTIGPATVEHDGYIYQSEEYSIDVIKDRQSALSNKTKRTKSDDDIFLRLHCNETNVFVGQKVPCTVRLYTDNGFVHLQHLSPSIVKNAQLSAVQGPVMGTEEINGKQYQYAQWSWNIYPEQSGELLIPAYSADYMVKTKNNHMFQGIASLLSLGNNTKRIYSNSVTLNVEKLPPHEKDVHAIGTFDKFSATITPGIAKEGEGILLTLEITGDGNWDQIEYCILEQLPDALKYYTSNIHTSENEKSKKGTKKFEFIIQGVESGNWEIPSQSFTYFDTQMGIYKTLYTAPLEITITPNAQLVQQKNIPSTPPLKTPEGDDSKSILFALQTSFSGSNTSKKPHLHWLLFYLCALFPFAGCIFLMNGKKYLQESTFCRYIVSYIQMRSALKKLHQLEKEKHASEIYNIVARYISEQNNMYLSTDISKLFEQNDMHKKDIVIDGKTWKQFYAQIVAASFDSSKPIGKQETKKLFQDARTWIYYIYKKNY